MNELESIGLYEKTSGKVLEEVMQNMTSSTKVKIDYRKIEYDVEWIEMMEIAIPYIDNILRNPNRFIVNDEEIVKIEMARKITVDSVKHLSKHTNLIQEVDKDSGDVKPARILNVNKEETYDTYENRFIYSLIQNMKIMIAKKRKILEDNIKKPTKGEKEIEYTGETKVEDEIVNVKALFNSRIDTKGKAGQKKKKQEREEKEKNGRAGKKEIQSLRDRINELEKKIMEVSTTEVYKTIDKAHIALVKSPLKKTNLMLKNVNFQYAVKLWDYIQENIDDQTKEISNKKEYEDHGRIKKLYDESFMLEYLTSKILDKDEKEQEEDVEELKDEMMERLVEKILNLDTNMTQQQLQAIIGEKFGKLKSQKTASLQEIQNIFKKHINKYMERVKG